jgi:methylmalonyl-CoA mutase
MKPETPYNLFEEFQPVTKTRWKEIATKDLRGADFTEQLVWKTAEPFEVEPYYDASDLDGLGYLEALGQTAQTDPAFGPRKWLNVAEVVVDDAQKANAEALHALNHGAEGILFVLPAPFDAPLDSLLKDILLPYCAVSFTGMQQGAALASRLVSYATGQGFAPAQLTGAIWPAQQQPLASLFEALAPLPAYRMGLMANQDGDQLTQPTSELLTSAVQLVEETGLPAAQVISKISFGLPIGNNYFFELARIRALRFLATQVVSCYGENSFTPAQVQIHAFTTISLDDKTKADPYLNMLSNTSQAMSAILGGCDLLTVYPHNRGIEPTDDFGKRIARNISVILREEAYFDKVADPAAGSYYLEKLTDQFSASIWEAFRQQFA